VKLWEKTILKKRKYNVLNIPEESIISMKREKVWYDNILKQWYEEKLFCIIKYYY